MWVPDYPDLALGVGGPSLPGPSSPSASGLRIPTSLSLEGEQEEEWGW